MPPRNSVAKQQEITLQEFALSQGMETREQRDAIQPGFWSWLMNVQPIGQRTLRILNGKGATLYTTPGGDSILWYGSTTIGTIPYQIVFLASGKADQVKISDGTITHISTVANTFWNSSGQYPHFTSVSNQGIVIVSPLGYWAWDGATLFSAGNSVQSPLWLNGASQNFTLTGSTHTTTTVTMSYTGGLVVGMTVSAAQNDIPSGTTIASITPNTSITLSAAATGTNASQTLTFSNGTTAATSSTVVMTTTGSTNSSTSVTSVSSTTGITVGMGIISSTGDIPSGTLVTAITSNTITLSQSATGTNASQTLELFWPMPSGIKGTAIEIYNSTPWIINGRTILAGAPSNGATFATTLGGVSLTVKDAYVQQGYYGIKALDGFLYLLAASATDVISDVQTTGTVPTTTFLRVPVSTAIGSPWRDSVVASPISIVCANTAGVYEIQGGTIRKVSDSFDGIFETASFPVASTDPSGFHPSAALLTLSEVPIYAMTITVTDPDTSMTVKALGCWDGRRWFLSTQETGPTIANSQNSGSVYSLWASDGNVIFEAFATASSTLTKKAKSWITATQSGISMRKMLKRAYAQFANAPPGAPLTQFNIDTESSTFPTNAIGQPGIITFVNNSGQTIQFQNNSGQNIFFTGVYPLVAAGNAGGIICIFFGVTVGTTAPTLDIVGIGIGFIDYSRYE